MQVCSKAQNYVVYNCTMNLSTIKKQHSTQHNCLHNIRCRNPSVRKRQRSTLLIGSRPSGEERRGNQPRIGFHEYGSMAQERAHRIIRQAHKRHVAHRRGFLQARGMDRQGWREALQNHHGCNQVLRVSRQGGDSCGRAGQASNQERQEIAFPLHNKATFGSLLFCSGISICCYSVYLLR